MKIGVLCSGNLGYEILKDLFKNQTVLFVLTDRNSLEVQSFCNSNKIPIYIGNPRNESCKRFVKAFEIDVIASVNYLFIIEKEIFMQAKILAFNVHGSLLPKYRGRTPHVWAIINGESETGITAHVINEGCDTGGIISQIKIPIDPNATGNDILIQFKINYKKLIQHVFQQIENSEINITPQNEELATYFNKRIASDGQINWNWQKERIKNWIRAQADPYPGAFTFLNDKQIIIDEVEFSNYGFLNEMPNGLILQETPILVKTSNGVLEIKKIREKINLKKGDILK